MGASQCESTHDEEQTRMSVPLISKSRTDIKSKVGQTFLSVLSEVPFCHSLGYTTQLAVALGTHHWLCMMRSQFVIIRPSFCDSIH